MSCKTESQSVLSIILGDKFIFFDWYLFLNIYHPQWVEIALFASFMPTLLHIFTPMILIKSKHKEFMPFKESRDLILTISHPKDKNKMAKSGHIG